MHVAVSGMLTFCAHLRARRNAQGQLEPDAPEDVVQASQGWSDVKFVQRPGTGT